MVATLTSLPNVDQIVARRIPGGRPANNQESRGGGGGERGETNVLNDDDKVIMKVIGIGSYRNDKCNPYHPSVYTRVSSYLDFIKGTMDDDGDGKL
jgi:hypothetical protein